MPRSPINRAEKLNRVKPMVMRMLDRFEDIPASLKKILLRPCLEDSEDGDEILHVIYHSGIDKKSRECLEISNFTELIWNMTLEEKARHMASLVEMLKGLVARHQRLVSAELCSCPLWLKYAIDFVIYYIEAVQGAENEGTSGELVRFVEYVTGTMSVKLESLLPHLFGIQVDYLLTCFSNERFHACGIRETDLLMEERMACNVHFCLVLLQHGFKYSFHQGYYEHVCLRTCFQSNVEERGPMDYLKNSGNLRKQMALEILHHLLLRDINSEWSRTEEIFLSSLWQTLPDPYITPKELYHLMEPLFQGSREKVLVDACALYERATRIPPEKQPRSLKHLARVRIRESMVRAHTIGEKAVRSLGLPTTLEDYLWELDVF